MRAHNKVTDFRVLLFCRILSAGLTEKSPGLFGRRSRFELLHDAGEDACIVIVFFADSLVNAVQPVIVKVAFMGHTQQHIHSHDSLLRSNIVLVSAMTSPVDHCAQKRSSRQALRRSQQYRTNVPPWLGGSYFYNCNWGDSSNRFC